MSMDPSIWNGRSGRKLPLGTWNGRRVIIPVRFQVCRSLNVTEQMLIEQVRVLNAAFNGTEHCVGHVAYEPQYADTGIQFVLKKTMWIDDADKCKSFNIHESGIAIVNITRGAKRSDNAKHLASRERLRDMAPNEKGTISVLLVDQGEGYNSRLLHYNAVVAPLEITDNNAAAFPTGDISNYLNYTDIKIIMEVSMLPGFHGDSDLNQKIAARVRNTIKQFERRCGKDQMCINSELSKWQETREAYEERQNQGAITHPFGRTLPHEMGHYLGLWHTFHPGGLEADETKTNLTYCETLARLKFDGVEDTRRDTTTIPEACPVERVGQKEIDTTGQKCYPDEQEPIHNFMNYVGEGRCWCTFTRGQAEKMWKTIEKNFPEIFKTSAPPGASESENHTGKGSGKSGSGRARGQSHGRWRLI